MQTTVRRTGRPPKPAGERAESHNFRVPGQLWAEVEEWIPAGERTAVVAEAFRREVVKRKKAAQHEAMLREEA